LKELCSVLVKGGFYLHKIVTNCPYVRVVASSLERVKKDTSDGSNSTIETALGVKWYADEDHFIFMLAHLKNGKHPTTRRECLSLIALMFDPMGFIAPYLLRPKKALQHLCRLILGWDKVVPEEDLTII
jgi:hypothetical protein